MKKLFCLLLVVVLMFSMVACGNKKESEEPTKPTENAQTETKPSDKETEQTQPTEKEEPTTPTEKPTESTEPEEEFVPELLSYRIYIPNQDANGFNTEIIECEEITIEGIIAALKEHKALPEDVIVKNFEFVGHQIKVDFNEAFGNLLHNMGTSGEGMITGMIVNTLIDAYDVEYVSFTVEGEIFESGHVIYDSPLGFVFVGQ